MIIKREDGTFSGDYVFKSETKITKETLEKALNRVRTFLSYDECYGEILYVHNLRELYKKGIHKFFMVDLTHTLIKILSVEVIDDEDNIGVRIVFKPRFKGGEPDQLKTQLLDWIETNQMALLPRMLGSKHENQITHFDIFTFDLVPRENAEIDIGKFMRHE